MIQKTLKKFLGSKNPTLYLCFLILAIVFVEILRIVVSLPGRLLGKKSPAVGAPPMFVAASTLEHLQVSRGLQAGDEITTEGLHKAAADLCRQ